MDGGIARIGVPPEQQRPIQGSQITVSNMVGNCSYPRQAATDGLLLSGAKIVSSLLLMLVIQMVPLLSLLLLLLLFLLEMSSSVETAAEDTESRWNFLGQRRKADVALQAVRHQVSSWGPPAYLSGQLCLRSIR